MPTGTATREAPSRRRADRDSSSVTGSACAILRTHRRAGDPGDAELALQEPLCPRRLEAEIVPELGQQRPVDARGCGRPAHRPPALEFMPTKRDTGSAGSRRMRKKTAMTRQKLDDPMTSRRTMYRDSIGGFRQASWMGGRAGMNRRGRSDSLHAQVRIADRVVGIPAHALQLVANRPTASCTRRSAAMRHRAAMSVLYLDEHLRALGRVGLHAGLGPHLVDLGVASS